MLFCSSYFLPSLYYPFIRLLFTYASFINVYYFYIYSFSIFTLILVFVLFYFCFNFFTYTKNYTNYLISV